MNKLIKKIIGIILLLITLGTYGQTIQIYHGTKGTTQVINGNDTHKFRYKKGEEITIEVINAHPALYAYEFNNEKIEIVDPEAPDFSDLVAVLAKLLNKRIPISNSNNTAITTTVRKPLTPPWHDLYAKKINELNDKINKAKKIIEDSDYPKTLEQAKNYSTDGGFLYAQKELSKFDLFKKDLKKYMNDWVEKIKDKNSPNLYDPSDKKQEVLMKLYDHYFKSMAKHAETIIKEYSKDISATKKFKVTMDAKINKVTLNIKSKDKKLNIRETGEKLIAIELLPYYDRPILELVPTGLFHKSDGGKVFSVQDGIIHEANGSNFEFSVGAMLNFNILNWGDSKEFSLGTGIGFAVVEKSFDNFFFSASVNYRQWARIGVGYGFLKTATGLKHNLQAGDPLDDVSNIDDLLTFERKPALFFTFVIPGLTLPVGK